MHKWHTGAKYAVSSAHKGLVEEIKELKKLYKSIKKISTNEEKWIINMKRLYIKMKYRWFLEHMKRCSLRKSGNQILKYTDLLLFICQTGS